VNLITPVTALAAPPGRFRLELLGAAHPRDDFDCGSDALNRYLKTQATQDSRRGMGNCYVAVEVSSGRLAGFYTLVAAGVAMTDLPEALSRRLPRYPSVPVALVGRLAVDRSFQGQKIGAALLADAVLRSLRAELAVFAIAVDAKDDAAQAFYLHHGFLHLAQRRLILPLSSFRHAA
jgi:GNAT superfamily N-acetyltransferase